MANAITLLVSDDSQLAKTIKGLVYPLDRLEVEVCKDFESARKHFQRDELALVLIHLGDGGHDEISTNLQTILSARSDCAVLMLANRYRNEEAVAMLRAGATDYFDVAQDLTKLAYLIDVLTMRSRGVESPSPVPREKPKAEANSAAFSYIIDPEIVALMGQVRRVVNQDTTLLLTGDTGTGKTRLARLIHELSPRHDQPFMVIDCAGLSANLIESEMFGHIKGAFTSADCHREGKFSAVGRGTILLDDINVLPLPLQSKLLRVVDERVFEPIGSNKVQPMQARLIAASNACLDNEVKEGRFRADLYFRLNVVGFYLPPLRERRQAVAPLANKFVAEVAKRINREHCSISSDALRALTDYDWPGNVRELRNIIERCVLLAPGPHIQIGDLPPKIAHQKHEMNQGGQPGSNGHEFKGPHFDNEQMSKEEKEIVRISEALIKHGNNRLRAAAELGISRMGLYKKLHKYGLINGTSQKNEAKSSRTN